MNLEEIAGQIAPYLPPALGSMIGLHWAKNQSPVQKATGFVGGFGLAVYCAPAAAELLTLGPRSTVAVGILIAVMGMDIVGGLMVAAAAFRVSPLDSFKSWWSAWFSRGQS